MRRRLRTLECLKAALPCPDCRGAEPAGVVVRHHDDHAAPTEPAQCPTCGRAVVIVMTWPEGTGDGAS
jgi:hypothetical protein